MSAPNWLRLWLLGLHPDEEEADRLALLDHAQAVKDLRAELADLRAHPTLPPALVGICASGPLRGVTGGRWHTGGFALLSPGESCSVVARSFVDGMDHAHAWAAWPAPAESPPTDEAPGPLVGTPPIVVVEMYAGGTNYIRGRGEDHSGIPVSEAVAMPQDQRSWCAGSVVTAEFRWPAKPLRGTW